MTVAKGAYSTIVAYLTYEKIGIGLNESRLEQVEEATVRTSARPRALPARLRRSVYAAIVRPLLAVMMFVGLASCWHPSDSEMTETFRKHRGAFESLRTMLIEDKNLACVQRKSYATVEAVFRSRYTSSIHLSNERWSEYRALMSKVGVERACRGDAPRDDVFLFEVSSFGTTFGSSTKSVVVLQGPAPRRGSCRAIPLSDDWYIEYCSD